MPLSSRDVLPESQLRCSELINEDIAANDGAAGGVTVAQVDREEVVGAWKTVVSHIDNETNLLLSGTSCSGDVGMIAGNDQSRDAG